MPPIATVVLFLLAPAMALAQAPRPRTYANPIDIDYRYNFEQHDQKISYRSGADPVIVVHKGAYYLFETIGDGYWRSTDLGSWQHVTPTKWPLTDVVAPAALSVRDTIYLLPSTTTPLPILMLTEPASGRVEFYNRLLPPMPNARYREADSLAKPDSVQPGPWDPAFFHDPDTDRWFLYWSSSNAYPLHGIELDKSRQLAYRGTPRWLFGLNPSYHGWERFGRDHRDSTIKPFIEGAWMTKYAGRYYLQYGAPGTEYNVYGTGTVPTPVWGVVTDCSACHTTPIAASGPATGSHVAHGAFTCVDCHNAGTTATVAPTTGHADGNIDVTDGYPANVAKHTTASGFGGRTLTPNCRLNESSRKSIQSSLAGFSRRAGTLPVRFSARAGVMLKHWPRFRTTKLMRSGKRRSARPVTLGSCGSPRGCGSSRTTKRRSFRPWTGHLLP